MLGIQHSSDRLLACSRETPPIPLLSIIVPVYNEKRTIDQVIDRIAMLRLTHEVVLVDDGSDDGTTERVRRLGERPGVVALFHHRNLGKGAAIRTALQRCRGEMIVIQDADLEYDPIEIERLIAPLVARQADAVFGSRFAAGAVDGYSVLRLTANRLLTWLSNLFTGLALTDMETCYKAMHREVAATLSIRENSFGIEPELTAKIARGGWRVIETPISYHPRDYTTGKKIRLRDGLRALWCIVRYSCWD